MMHVTVLDPSISNRNLGDAIIMQAVSAELQALIAGAYFYRVPTQDYAGQAARAIVERSDLVFVGGTNLLSSNMDRYRQWKVRLQDRFWRHSAILMGVGWWKYQPEPNLYTRLLLRRVLHRQVAHSVRDAYALRKLASAGVRNALNTACPTMWGLTPDHCRTIPAHKADCVLMTVTDYRPDVPADRTLLALLQQEYSRVFLWLQGAGDYAYVRGNLPGGFELVDPSVEALDELLASGISLDYVGTRLHAGIRALRHRRRTVVVGVDNRAQEKGGDFRLPVVRRSDLAALPAQINREFETRLDLPWEAIEQWRGQVQSLSLGREPARSGPEGTHDRN